MFKSIIVGVVALALLVAMPAIAAGPNPPGTENAPDAAGLTEVNTGSCSGCFGWVWAHALETWRYVSGTELLWLDFRESRPNYAIVDTAGNRDEMFIAACVSNNWIGIYWTSSTSFSNVRLWYV